MYANQITGAYKSYHIFSEKGKSLCFFFLFAEIYISGITKSENPANLIHLTFFYQL